MEVENTDTLRKLAELRNELRFCQDEYNGTRCTGFGGKWLARTEKAQKALDDFMKEHPELNTT